MTIRLSNPSGIAAPVGAYSHGATTEGPGRTLYIAGQLGIYADGTLAEGFAAQAEQCLRNVIAVLTANDMTAQNLVKVTTFLTDMTHAPLLGPIRAPLLDGARPASTLVGTSGLVRPEWLIEIEAIAFAAL